MKIVIDTNVIASAIFFGGKPKTLIELLISHQMDAYVTDEIVTEYKETLTELVSRYPAKALYSYCPDTGLLQVHINNQPHRHMPRP